MSEFSVQDASLRCDFLTINQVPFPQTYPTISNFLKYDAQLQELVWDIASTSVATNETDNEYLILSATKGNEGGSVTMNPKTSSNIRGGIGVRDDRGTSGGPDGKGTGLTYTPKGQITIGLTKENTDIISATNEKGVSMTDYTSLSHKELFINSINDTKYYNSNYEQVPKPTNSSIFGTLTNNIVGIDLPGFDSGIKVNTEGYYKQENSSHVSIGNTNEVLTNKVLKDPIIDGTLVVDKENTSFGFESNGANTGSYDGYTISGTMRSDGIASISNLSTGSNTAFSANLDYDSSDIDGYYKGWTIQATTDNNTYYDTITDYPLFKSVINGKMTDDTHQLYNNEISIKININDFDLYKYLDAGHIVSDNTITKRLDNNQKQTLAVNYFKGWKIYINDIEKTILTSEIDASGLKHTININPIDDNWDFLKAGTNVKIYIPDNIFYGTMSGQNTITSIGSITDSSDFDFYKGWTIIMETNNIRQSATITSSNNGLITYDRGGGGNNFNFGDAASSNQTKYQLIPPKRIILSGNHLTTPNTSYILSPPRNNRGISSLAVTGCSEVLRKRITKTIDNGEDHVTKELYLDNVENLKVGMIMYDSIDSIKTYTKSTTIQLIETDKVY